MGFGAWRELIVDSDVLIDALRGNAPTIEWLHTQRRNHRELRYSVVSRAELMAGPRHQELALITTFLATMEPVVIDTATADIAGDQLARYAGSHGVQLGDALIAAAVIQHGESLATFNRKDFPGVVHFEHPAR